MSGRNLPFIGIPSCVRTINERQFHTVNDRYTDAVVEAAGCLPVVIPAIGPKTDIGALLDRLDGLLLTGSPSTSSRPITAARRAARARCTTPTATPRPCR